MSTFYQGSRYVLKGRDSDDNIHTYKNKVGKYSNWAIFNTSHVLDGAPDHNHDPGTGREPHDIFMSRRFRGLDTKNPLDNAPDGAHIVGMRFRPLQYKGIVSVFPSGYGHASRDDVFVWSNFSNLEYHGLTATKTLVNAGHAKRYVGAAGTAATFGAFDPLIYKGTTPGALTNVPGNTHIYGHAKINEWVGVASAKAL